jgi:phospholipid/cholesterol/gamma-HCH transport system substrate-binding protein
MIKETPSPLRIVAMVVFTLSVFGLLMFLWLSFGGSIPLRPKGYRVEVAFPEAATLAQEADVRMAGVNIGKVKKKRLDKGGARTIVELELKSQYAPIPKDSRAILRQKTLLGETYVQLSEGHKSAGMLPDHGRLANDQVEPTTELDEIFSAFDKPTRAAFQDWVHELSRAIQHHSPGPAENLNDAFGNLPGFAVDGAKLFKTLDEQEIAVRRLVKNTGVVFGAINQRQGALHDLILNANNTFEATQSRDQALAETFSIFPTFLDESKATLARLETFSRNAHPLINDLKRPADDLGPTIHDLGNLSPDLTHLFHNLNPLVRAGDRGAPALERTLKEAGPVLDNLHPFLQQLNPILSLFNFYQQTVAGFLDFAGANLAGKWADGQRVQAVVTVLDGRSFESHRDATPFWARGNSYLQPNTYDRAIPLGVIESFTCSHVTRADGSRGRQVEPDDQVNNSNPLTKDANKTPPCLVSPPSLYNGKLSIRLERGEAPIRDRPGFRQGSDGPTTVDPHPGDPLH